MNTFLVILLVSLLHFYKIFCQLEYGNIYPTPLTVRNEDMNFEQCPNKNGAYAHTSNCSLFHLCTFGIHTIHSCVDGFFFNPTSRRCQYLPMEQRTTCDIIRQIMQHSLVEFVSVPDLRHHRKSINSTCTRTGIHPDLLDCSVFHYCRESTQHEIIQCPHGLRFDPKTLLCLSSQLVDCQYEPSSRLDDETNNINSNGYSSILLDTICRDYAPGTYLPISNHFDKFLICRNDGGSVVMKCQPGFTYNALTTACEAGPCTFDSTLCENEGQCVDDLNAEKGFKCICSHQYEGKFCENSKSMINESFNDAFELNSDQQQQQQEPREHIFQTGLIFAASLIGVVLVGAIIFAVITLIRLVCFTSMMDAARWSTLREESVV